MIYQQHIIEIIIKNMQQKSGFHYFMQGFSLISKAKLRRYVVLPLLCNIILFIGLLYLTIHWIQVATGWITSTLPHWLDWLSWLLWPIFLIAFILVLYYTFTLIANLIATPFNAILSEKTQLYLTGKELESSSFWQLVTREAPRNIKRQVRMLLYYIPRAVVALLLFVIPGVQAIAPITWFLFGAWMMTVQYVDYPMDNNRVPFKQMRKELMGKFGLSMSFGTAVTIATMIPVVNFIVMPVAVIGATALWADYYNK